MEAKKVQLALAGVSLITCFTAAAVAVNVANTTRSIATISGYPFDIETEGDKSPTEQAADWVAYYEPQFEKLFQVDLDPASVKSINFDPNTLKGDFMMASTDKTTVVAVNAQCTKAGDVLVCGLSRSLG